MYRGCGNHASMNKSPAKAKTKPKPAVKKKPVSNTPARSKGKVGVVVRTLSALEQRFVDEYIIDYNATQAALRAGYAYSTADSKSPLWVGKKRESCPVNKLHIWDAVQEARKAQQGRTEITADRVLREAARLALFDPRKLFNPDGTPKPVHELDDDTAAAIGGIDVVSIGNAENGVGQVLKYKVSDKNSALEKLFKHLGLYEATNKQLTDPLAQLLETISKSGGSAFKPTAVDPEHDEE